MINLYLCHRIAGPHSCYGSEFKQVLYESNHSIRCMSANDGSLRTKEPENSCQR